MPHVVGAIKVIRANYITTFGAIKAIRAKRCSDVGAIRPTLKTTPTTSKANEFEVIIQNLLDDDELSPAHDMLDQVKRVLRSSADDVLKKMEIVGKTAFETDLRSDNQFWTELGNEGGIGYRDSIATISGQWFKFTQRASKHAFVRDKIIESWKEILASLDELIGSAPRE